MGYYTPQDDTWTETSTAPAQPPYIEVAAERPALHLVGPETTHEMPAAPARTDAETVHTVTLLSPTLDDATALCALRASGNDLTVEDRRPPGARTQFGDVLDHLQSAMDEILIPLYIDDAIEEASASISGVSVLHTAQYDDPPRGACSYFRAAAFADETLLLETERGAL